MADTLASWGDVVAFACTLPGVETGTTYGRPAVKLRGKMLAATTAPDPGSFVLHTALDEKEVLIATDPETFWESDHYRGWPAVLVRYAAPDADRVRTVIARAWWDRASVAQRKVFGNRP
jgi:hypothetical protein